nr:hypothetical protein [Nonomuraea roseoviolacea]
MAAQRGAGRGYRSRVRVQVSLGRAQRPVTGDLSQHVHRDTRISHPRQPRVTQVVTPQVLEAETGDHLVPMRGIPQHSGGDASAPRAGEQPGGRIVIHLGHATGDEVADLLDERHSPGALALGALVDQPTGTWRGLAPHRPGPRPGVDVADPHARGLADPCRGGGGEDPDITPARVLARGAAHERGGQTEERRPVRQGESARIVQLVLGEAVLALPTRHACRVAFNDAVPDGLLHDPHQHGQAVLDGGSAAAVRDPAADHPVDGSVRDHAHGEMAQSWDDALVPAGQVRVERLGLESAHRQLHDALAIFGQGGGGEPGVNATLGQSLHAGDPRFRVVGRLERLGPRLALFRRRLDPPDTGSIRR